MPNPKRESFESGNGDKISSAQIKQFQPETTLPFSKMSFYGGATGAGLYGAPVVCYSRFTYVFIGFLIGAFLILIIWLIVWVLTSLTPANCSISTYASIPDSQTGKPFTCDPNTGQELMAFVPGTCGSKNCPTTKLFTTNNCPGKAQMYFSFPFYPFGSLGPTGYTYLFVT